jgi:hypothetical protein
MPANTLSRIDGGITQQSARRYVVKSNHGRNYSRRSPSGLSCRRESRIATLMFGSPCWRSQIS